MKTFQLTILKENHEVLRVLNELAAKHLIEFKEITEQAVTPNEEQVQEIIDESELGPYYSEKDAKDILKL